MSEQPYRTIPLSGKNGMGEVAFVAPEDYDQLIGCRWNRHKEGYATARINKKQVLMHRLILQAPAGVGVDHINQNRLDNRRSNLRLADKSQNAQNSQSHRDSSSQYKGVSWNKRKNRWLACIYFDKKHHCLGYFRNEIDAARAYDCAAQSRFGEFARVNFSEGVQ